jgi:hypothetical protein
MTISFIKNFCIYFVFWAFLSAMAASFQWFGRRYFGDKNGGCVSINQATGRQKATWFPLFILFVA